MPTLEILVGMIGSGKSTYAKRRASEGTLVVCHDALCMMLHANTLGGCGYEESLREIYQRMQESLAWHGLSAGYDVIIDRTHLTRESRARWLRWADNRNSLRAPKTPVIAVAFPWAGSAQAHAVRRFNADPRGRSFEEWLKVAEHHAAQARSEPLHPDEGFDRIEYIGNVT